MINSPNLTAKHIDVVKNIPEQMKSKMHSAVFKAQPTAMFYHDQISSVNTH